MLLTFVVWAFGIHDVSRIGDIAAIDVSLPSFLLPDVPFSWETLLIILPYSLSLAVVGFTETMLTQNLLDETTGEKDGQKPRNARSGHREFHRGLLRRHGRLRARGGIGAQRARWAAATGCRRSWPRCSCCCSSSCCGDLLSLVPMAALVGIMLMVCAAIFDWKSVFKVREVPVSETVVMVITVAAVVVTHDLAVGVIAGVIVSGIFALLQRRPGAGPWKGRETMQAGSIYDAKWRERGIPAEDRRLLL